MKNKFLISIVLITTIVFSASHSKGQAFLNEDNVAGLGLGLGSAIGASSYTVSGYSQSTTRSPGIGLSYEHGFWETAGPGVVSLGGYLGYTSSSTTFSSKTYTSRSKLTYTIVGFRGAYHYSGLHSNNWDAYGGLMLSFNIPGYSYSSTDQNSNTYLSQEYATIISFSFYLGGRYFFTDNVAAFAEAGYGVSYLSLGVAIKFGVQ